MNIEAISQHKVNLLRRELVNTHMDGFIIPSNDEFMGEYVPDYAKRLEWLTGFSGSNGIAVVLADQAAFFTDGRYILQASNQLDTDIFEIFNLADTPLGAWLSRNVRNKVIGIDPWLHSYAQMMNISGALAKAAVKLEHCTTNLIDHIWHDKPSKKTTNIINYDITYSGEDHIAKIARLADELTTQDIHAAIITAPDSICWLLNIRGNDVLYTPLVLCRAILYQDSSLDLFVDNCHYDKAVQTKFGDQIRIYSASDIEEIISKFTNKNIKLDQCSAPVWFATKLEQYGAKIVAGNDPCQLPKACKNKVEQAGMVEAHIHDGIAVCKFLHWFERANHQQEISELSIVEALLKFRNEQPDFVYPSFATIAGFAANGAIIHYNPEPATNKVITGDGLLLIDSGGQYKNGTTDITRTIAVGTPTLEQKEMFTRVLKGHIKLASAVFPKGLSGSQLDVLARYALWQAGHDYDHGTGHGVGSFLGVHEGPQRIAKKSENVALCPGMVVSNEPGFYKVGEYGIRIENLVMVVKAADFGSEKFLRFETLTLVPIDSKLIMIDMLDNHELERLNLYHQKIWQMLSKRIKDQDLLDWLYNATQQISR